MKSIKFYCLMLAIVFPVFGRASTSTSTQKNPIATYSQQLLLKNWALSICLANISSDEKAIKDASATASAYLEFGKQDLEAYDELRVLVKKYANLKYGAKPDLGQPPPELNTMKCIDLFHSKELDALTRRLAKAVRK